MHIPPPRAGNKIFADNEFSFDANELKLSDKAENIVGKGENAG